jgi:hypothetical protein
MDGEGWETLLGLDTKTKTKKKKKKVLGGLTPPEE